MYHSTYCLYPGTQCKLAWVVWVDVPRYFAH